MTRDFLKSVDAVDLLRTTVLKSLVSIESIAIPCRACHLQVSADLGHTPGSKMPRNRAEGRRYFLIPTNRCWKVENAERCKRSSGPNWGRKSNVIQRTPYGRSQRPIVPRGRAAGCHHAMISLSSKEVRAAPQTLHPRQSRPSITYR